MKNIKLIRSNTRAGLAVAAVLAVCFAGRLYAIKDETNQNRWEKPCANGPDAEVPGFLVNMGPTGARGILKESSFVVKYIFPKSPAAAVLQIDDEVTAANGKKFNKHTFSGSSAAGIAGPIQDMGLAIEDSEGTDGVLRLGLLRKGAPLTVNIQLEKLGRFADTFPVNCRKTDMLKARAYKYLIENSEGVNSQGRCVTILAMLSSDDAKVFAEGKRRAKEWDKVPGQNTWTWHLGFQAMTLAEYYIVTKDKSVLGTLKTVLDMLRDAQWKGPNIRRWSSTDMTGTVVDQATIDRHQALYEGGFGHCTYTEVLERAGGGYGGGGYGPMQRPTYLAILAWQLGKQCGIEVKHPGIEQAFTFVEYGTTASGNTAYGGEFTLNNGPVDSKNWKKSNAPGNSHKSGMAYLVYKLSSERTESKQKMALHLKNIDAAFMDMPDGHACPMMGLVWGWAGVYASENTALKKKITDYYKAWLNMARCHGSDSYVILPGRNYADESYYSGNIRNHTTGSVAFLYSFSKPKLQLQGGMSGAGAGSGGLSKPGAARPAARKARSISVENRAILDRSLQSVLAKMSAAGELKAVPLRVSMTRSQVWLKSFTDEGALTFALVGGDKTVDFKWADLTAGDHETVAILVAMLKQDSSDAQAMAAVYMESMGRVSEADKYFEKAGPEARQKLEKLFTGEPKPGSSSEDESELADLPDQE